MKLEIKKGSENYTCQVIKLPKKQEVQGLDNLCKITYQGNDVLTQKDTDENQLYLFFPAECAISNSYLSVNNEFRNQELNDDKSKKGYFEDNCRVKSIKFKGVISTGYLAPINTLEQMMGNWGGKLKEGDEFTDIDGVNICKKYVIKQRNSGANLGKSSKILDNIVDSKLAPEHFDTEHLLKNCHKLHLDDYIAVTYKLHGTSARYFNTLTFKKLSWFEKLLKKVGINIVTEEYREVVGSRKVIKSVKFNELEGKNHFYKESGDIWTKVGEEYLKGKLFKGEAVYCEIIGKTYTGEAIQKGYSYGFDKPILYIYRISNINPQGIEVDLSYHQMIERSKQLNIPVCPEFFYGNLRNFIAANSEYYTEEVPDNFEIVISDLFYNTLLEKPSILDKSVIEEGFCIRVDKYPKPQIFKIKSKKFLLHESGALDKGQEDLESNN